MVTDEKSKEHTTDKNNIFTEKSTQIFQKEDSVFAQYQMDRSFTEVFYPAVVVSATKRQSPNSMISVKFDDGSQMQTKAKKRIMLNFQAQ